MADYGRALTGFVKGFADTGLEGLRSRQKEEADIRKAKLLSQLKLETSKELAEFEVDIANRRVDKQQTQFDLGAGKKRLYNTEGTMIGEQDLTDYEKQQLSREGEKSSLELQNIRSQIAERGASGRRQDQELALRRRALDRGGSETGDLKTLADRISVANAITQNLGKQGFQDDEILAARQQLLEGARKGWNLNQFTLFEEEFSGNPLMRKSIRTRTDDMRMSKIVGSND